MIAKPAVDRKPVDRVNALIDDAVAKGAALVINIDLSASAP